jgi:uncharacterized surface protein with fasciclin (FAS1) repeats
MRMHFICCSNYSIFVPGNDTKFSLITYFIMHISNLLLLLVVLPLPASARERSSLRNLKLLLNEENDMWTRELTMSVGSMPIPAPYQTRAPIKKPVSSPIAKSPTAPSTVAPIKMPVYRPTTFAPDSMPAPVVSPIQTPVSSPIAPPITFAPDSMPAPVVSPMQTPVSSPIAAPITFAPDSMPVSAPVTPTTTANMTILDLIRSNPDLTTLYKAIVAAGPRVEAQIATSNPETFFAPINSAWTALGSYLNVLVSNPAYNLHLRYFVKNHFTLNGAYSQGDLTNGKTFTVASGEPTSVLVDARGTKQIQPFAATTGKTTPSAIISTGKAASNGVLYTIGDTLTPVWYYEDLCSLLQNQPQFTTLYSLVQASSLCVVLASSQTSTLLAPNDKAFAALPANLLTYLTNPDNVVDLRTVLLYHFLPTDLVDPLNYPVAQKISFNSAEGSDVVFRVTNNGSNQAVVSFNGVTTVGTLLLTKYNIEFELPQVLVPPDFKPSTTAAALIAAQSAPVTAPIALPSAVPVAPPVIAPVAQPVTAPVAAPIAVPVAAPVASPVLLPTGPLPSPAIKSQTAPPIQVKSPTNKIDTLSPVPIIVVPPT